MKTDLYAIYEWTGREERLRGLWPVDELDAALQWADGQSMPFHAAFAGPDHASAGELHLKKVHGVELFDPADGGKEEDENE